MFPDLPAIDEGYKLKWSQVGDTFHEIATFGDGTSFNTSWKYDVETPFMGKYLNVQEMFLNWTKIHGFYKYSATKVMKDTYSLVPL